MAATEAKVAMRAERMLTTKDLERGESERLGLIFDL